MPQELRSGGSWGTPSPPDSGGCGRKPTLAWRQLELATYRKGPAHRLSWYLCAE